MRYCVGRCEEIELLSGHCERVIKLLSDSAGHCSVPCHPVNSLNILTLGNGSASYFLGDVFVCQEKGQFTIMACTLDRVLEVADLLGLKMKKHRSIYKKDFR